MPSEDMELRGLAAPPPVPDWLRGLIRGIRREGVKPKDPRLLQLWTLLRSRALLNRSPWLKDRLRYIWNKGLVARERPIGTRRLKQLLRSWGILPPAVVLSPGVTVPGVIRRPRFRPRHRLRPVRVQRVGRVRPVGQGRRWR